MRMYMQFLLISGINISSAYEIGDELLESKEWGGGSDGGASFGCQNG